MVLDTALVGAVSSDGVYGKFVNRNVRAGSDTCVCVCENDCDRRLQAQALTHNLHYTCQTARKTLRTVLIKIVG